MATRTAADETVGYVQADGLDAPLGLIKNSQPLMLHRNVEGLYILATDTNGARTT